MSPIHPDTIVFCSSMIEKKSPILNLCPLTMAEKGAIIKWGRMFSSIQYEVLLDVHDLM